MKIPASVLSALLFLAMLSTAACSLKPAAEIDDVLAHFKEAGMEVKEPDYGPLTGQIKELESGLDLAAGLGHNRPQIRTMDIAGVLTTIHRFKNRLEAETFYKIARDMPSTTQNLPKRMREMLGTPVYVQHKNIVLRMNEKTGDNGNAAAIKEIKEKLQGL